MTHLRSLVLFIALAVALPGAAHAGDRVALVIGVSSYTNPNIPRLANPASDAASVAAALRGVGFQVTQLNQPAQLTRDAIGTALVRFRAQAERSEAAVIYFAGHGVEVDGTNWLLPSDVMADSPDDLEVKAIPASSAINAVRGASAIRLVILDACRDNPFAANPGWASGKRAFGSRGLGRELGRADNVVLLLATQPGKKSSDGMGAVNSPFAKALAGALGTDGMQIAELPTLVSRRMLQDDRVEQRPDQQGIFDEPRWMFRPGALAAAPVPQPRPQPVQNYAQPAPQPQPGIDATALTAECERLAGGDQDRLLPVLAIPACTRAVEASPANARMKMLLGFTLYKNNDFAAARGWYEQAAANGDAASMNNLGVLYRDGNGVAKDFAQARSWFEQSAAKGIVFAMRNLGFLYVNGQGVPQDYVQARNWFEQAAAKGNVESMVQLGWQYDTGQGVARDYAQARNWYGQAAAKGDATAMRNLGYLYAYGQGVTQDYGQARTWYEQAAARGDVDAMTNLGLMYRDSQGVARDYAQARNWFEQAAAKGFANAMTDLGALYNSGLGVTQDYAMARRWYEQAAAKGEPYSMTNLGQLYANGQGVPQDMAQARRWYEQAAAKGQPTAKQWLAQHPQ